MDDQQPEAARVDTLDPTPSPTPQTPADQGEQDRQVIKTYRARSRVRSQAFPRRGAQQAAPGDGDKGRNRGRKPGFFRRNRDSLLINLGLVIIAFVLASLWDASAAARQVELEDVRAHRQEALENTRFVREKTGEGVEKPFQKLNLRDAALSGLDLQNADFDNANLQSADLSGSNLAGARLAHANLFDAFLAAANLSQATLSSADLSGAWLDTADLSGAWLWFTDLSGANLKDVCFDEHTRWPANFTPPEKPVCDWWDRPQR